MSKADISKNVHVLDCVKLGELNFNSLLKELRHQDRINWMLTETSNNACLTVYLEKGQIEFQKVK